MIDDDAPFLVLMDEVFTREGCAVITAPYSPATFALLRDTAPDLLHLDLAFPVIVVSTATDLLRTCAAEFAALNAVTLAKPFDLSHLIHLAGVLVPRGAGERRERMYA